MHRANAAFLTTHCRVEPRIPLLRCGGTKKDARRIALPGRLLLLCLLLAWLLLASAPAVFAAGPRYVTGQPFFTARAGFAVGWKQSLLLYSTDPGDLSGYVNHAAADALVAAAAGVWNLPVANLTVAQGPALAEHVSGQNVFQGANGLVLPADVMSSNAAAVPIAIVYDTDGSVTDTLLGVGASSASGCRQNAVTESVDAFDPAGYILHAVIVINGRCTGAAPEAQLQLRYQLMRVFGRVLGLAWSQTNDNVFTGSPQPTAVQAQNWPIMHPLDIICGLYTYQCLPSPFTLRPDDIGAMTLVYPINGAVPAGKQSSYAAAQGLLGYLYFPDGEGMAGVNVLVRSQAPDAATPLGYYAASGVSGTYGARGRSSPFVQADPGALGSEGSSDPGEQGAFFVPWFPIIGTTGYDGRIVTTEPVNPLYTGEYTLGAYPAGAVAPSGSPLSLTTHQLFAGVDSVQFTATDAALGCGTGADGTPAQPMQPPATGWWTGTTCGFGHVSYVGSFVRPGRTFTVEVTALDAQGFATQSKLMPVLGLYGPNDSPPYTVPTLGATVTAFNGSGAGTTTLHAATGSATNIRFGIADQRGDGRPDFNYQARLFYADTVTPTQVAAGGGTVTITGTGFRNGNAVTINGVAANVTSWSATTLVATLPSAAAANAGSGNAVDVTVSDRTTGATSTIAAALVYGGSAQSQSMVLVSAPAGTLEIDDVAAVPFSVRLLAADGVTPVPNAAVQLSVPYGQAGYGACGGAGACTLRTDAHGLIATQVTPLVVGGVVLQAAAGSLAQAIYFGTIAQAGAMLIVATPENPVRVGVASASAFAVQDVGADGKSPLSARAVTFTTTAGAAVLAPCFTASCTVQTDGSGTARVNVVAQAAGTVTLRAQDGDVSQTVSVAAIANADILRVTTALPAQFYLLEGPTLVVTLYRADGSTPDPYQNVTFSSSPGVVFNVCAAQACPVSTDYAGRATVTVGATVPGTYTVQMSFGSVVQSVTFTVLAHQYHLKLLSVPPDNSATGVVAAKPFTAQVVLDDGVTPAPIQGASIILGGNGSVSFTTCQWTECEVYVDSNSIASIGVIPQQPGPLTLSATFSPMVVTATFTAVGGTRTMTVVTQPGSEGAPYGVESALGVKVIQPDGVTPFASDLVLFRVLSGPYGFSAGSKSVQFNTGGDGVVVVGGFASGYGPVVVQATDGLVSTLISFTAGTPPRVLTVTSTPASPSNTGSVTAAPFAVQVFAQDGVTPAAGDTVTFSLTTGAAMLGCVAPCAVKTDSKGMASVTVAPTAAGIVSLLATDGLATVATSFVAAAAPDVLRVASAPASGGYVGTQSALPFTVQALLSDGVTPSAGRSISVAVTTGSATLAACAGAASCVLVSDAAGMLSTAVTATVAGTITLQAVDGNVSASASYTAIARPDTMRLLSAPSGSVGLGYAAATAFAVQVLQGDGVTADPGKVVVFSASPGSIRFGACAQATCSVTTGPDGTASTTITPLSAGPVSLVATEGTLVQTATFNAVPQPDTLRVTSLPASGGSVGTQASLPFAVQALLADGLTPAAGRAITFSVQTGAATFVACPGASTCVLTADAAGAVSSGIVPLSGGTITLRASDGQSTVSATFTAVALPDVLALVSAPSGSVFVGSPAAVAFAVRLLAADGVTPRAGAGIAFSASAGAAAFSGCNANPCVLLTDASGIASAVVTPLAAGPIVLLAASGSLSASASFTAVQNHQSVSSVDSSFFLAEGAVADVILSVVAAENGMPAAGEAIAWHGSAGLLPLAATSVTSTTGQAFVSAGAGPLAAGAQAQATGCAWSTVCATFVVQGVAAGELAPGFVAGAGQSVAAGAMLQPVLVAVTDSRGHAVAGAPLTIYQTVSAYAGPCPAQGRCPAAPVLATLVSAAVTGTDGRYTLSALSVEGQPTETQIAIAAGSNGFVATTLTRLP